MQNWGASGKDKEVDGHLRDQLLETDLDGKNGHQLVKWLTQGAMKGSCDDHHCHVLDGLQGLYIFLLAPEPNRCAVSQRVTVLAMVWSGLLVHLRYMCLDSLTRLGQDQTSLIPVHFRIACIWFFLFF